MNGTLKKINSNDIAKIASGQVIVDLRSVVKELIENSLDAKATSIDIRIINYGADLIEVTDNGTGIRESDFSGIALKYYTSKIESFGDIRNIDSFGFRGEALSCICELSGEFEVITRHESAEVGSLIRYNPNGSVASQQQRASNMGTTVCVKKLFDRLPVRRRAYLHSSKSQLSNMITLAQSYAISSLGVRFSLTHRVSATSSVTTILSVPANYSVKQRIQSIFGTAISSSLTEFGASFFLPRRASQDVSNSDSIVSGGDSEERVQTAPQNDSERLKYSYSSVCDWNPVLLDDPANELHGFVTGFVTRIGSSNNSSDRGNQNLSLKGNASKQLLFVNGRLIEYRKITNALVQVWRDYEPRTLPVMVINFVLPTDYYDINLSTDKKQVLFVREDILIAAFQEIFRMVVDAGNTKLQVESVPKLAKGDKVLSKREEGKPVTETKLKTKLGNVLVIEKPAKVITMLLQKEKKVDKKLPQPATNENPKPAVAEERRSAKREISEIPIVSEKKSRLTEPMEQASLLFQSSLTDVIPAVVDRCKKSKKQRDSNSAKQSKLSFASSNSSSDIKEPSNAKAKEPTKEKTAVQDTLFEDSNLQQSNVSLLFDSQSVPNSSNSQSIQKSVPSLPSSIASEQTASSLSRSLPFSVSGDYDQTWNVTLDSILSQFNAMTPSVINSSPSSTSFLHSDFAGDDTRSAEPEEELTRVLQKDSFNEMEVVGQFNNSFILCRLQQDLYILDQHACDEKSNYEKLMNEVVISSQKLIKPIPLELSPDQEFTILHNRSLFTQNGFEVMVSQSHELGKRIQLRSLPASKKYTFSVTDFMELLGVVMETGAAAQRTPKLSKIIAMQACHQSVRAGDPLSYPKMVSIVRGLAELDRPWSCPHGRPTLRHLVTLNS